MTSFIDPAFLGKRFTWLAVHCETNDLEQRSAIESALVGELQEKKGRAMQSTGLIMPTRAVDSAGIRNALLSAGFDGYLRIVETDRWNETYHVPREEKTTVKREIEEKKVGGRGRGEQKDSVVRIIESETSTTTTTGGYTGETINRQFRIELIELSTGRTAWVGASTVYGSVTSNAQYFGKRVAGQLQLDGMFVLAE